MSNIFRPFYIVRRRPHLLDALIPKAANMERYRLFAAPSFDAAFTQIIEARIGAGYLDPALMVSGAANGLQALNNPGQLRVTFDPATFSTVAGIADADQFWMTLQTVDFAGVVGPQSAPGLIVPEGLLRGDSLILFSGTAPNAASVANSQQLYFPCRAQNLTIRNEEAVTPLFVAMEGGGGEVMLEGGGGTLAQNVFPDGAAGGILVRGNGATAKFSVSFTSYLPL